MQAVKIEGKNIRDLFRLPCVASIVKDKDVPGGMFVYLDLLYVDWSCIKARKTTKAYVGEWLVEKEQGVWTVKKSP